MHFSICLHWTPCAAGRGGGGGYGSGSFLFQVGRGGVSTLVIWGSRSDHSWTILDHFADCAFNFVPMVLWTYGSFLRSYIVGISEFSFWVHFFKPHCRSIMLLRDTCIWKLHLWIIFCNTNWWINILLCACSRRYLHLEVAFLDHFLQHKLVDQYVVCACSRCHLCRICDSFLLLMNQSIISFTPCPFALVYSTFSYSSLVCVMPEPSSPAPRTVHVSELVVPKAAGHLGGEGGGVYGVGDP